MYEDIEEEYNNDKKEQKLRKAYKDGFTFKKFKKQLGSVVDELTDEDIYFLYEQEVIEKY